VWGGVSGRACAQGFTGEAKGLAILWFATTTEERPLAVINGSQGATALVDMADFVVGAQVLAEHEW
jgi:hypothetical protein